MSEDHAYQAISCYNNKLIQTPNIDRLAKEGVRFVQSFVTKSICAPSRAVLLTGKYSHENGVQDQYYIPNFIEMGERKRVHSYVTDITTDFGLNWLKKRDKSRSFCLLLHHKASHRDWMPNLKYLAEYRDCDLPLPETFYNDYSMRSEAAREQEMRISDHTFPEFDLNIRYDHKSETPEEKQDDSSWQSSYQRMDEEQRQQWDEAYEPQNEECCK